MLLSRAVTSCFTSHHTYHNSLVACKYEPNSKTTKFSYIGDISCTVAIPGEWKHLGFDQSSRDNVFSDSLDQKLFIFKGGRGTSSFNKKNLDGNEFIRLFYDWDSKWYVANSPGLTAKVLHENDGNYLIAEYADSTMEATALYGTKNGNGVRITIVSKHNKNPQTDFVSTLYTKLQ